MFNTVSFAPWQRTFFPVLVSPENAKEKKTSSSREHIFIVVAAKLYYEFLKKWAGIPVVTTDCLLPTRKFLTFWLGWNHITPPVKVLWPCTNFSQLCFCVRSRFDTIKISNYLPAILKQGIRRRHVWAKHLFIDYNDDETTPLGGREGKRTWRTT